MTSALSDLARLVNGRLTGDGYIPISGAAPLSDAGMGQITLVDQPKALQRLSQSAAAAVLVPEHVQPTGIPFITVRHVHRAFTAIVEHFRPPRRSPWCGISPAAHVSATAQLGKDVTIHAGATIGDHVSVGDRCIIHPGVQIMADCQIGDDVVLFPNAVLYERTIIGPRVIIHAGSVLGAYGFGYETTDGRHQRTAQLGHVEIHADVEIGACTTIDRGTYGATVIGEGTKLDNHVMVAHNCRLGRHNLICSQVGIAGSCTTGDYVVMAGQVGMADHITLGDGVILGAKAGVMHDVLQSGTYVGIPATPAREQMVKQAVLGKLPEMRKELKALQRAIERLEQPRRDAA